MANKSFRDQEPSFSLVDYIAVLAKWWKFGIAIVVVFLVVGAIQWTRRPENPFPYRTAIEIASVEDVNTVKSKLISVYIPLVLKDYAVKNGKDDAGYSIDVESDASRTVILKSSGSKADEGAIVGIHQAVADLLIADHLKKAAGIEQSLQQQKFEAELALAQIKEDAKSITDAIDMFEGKIALAKSQLGSITELVKSLEKDRSFALSRGGSATNGSFATSIFSIDNSIAQYRDQMRKMEDRIYIDLQNERYNLGKDIIKNQQNQRRQEEAIRKIEKDLLNPYGSRLLLPPSRLLRLAKTGSLQQTLIIFGTIGFIVSLVAVAFVELMIRALRQNDLAIKPWHEKKIPISAPPAFERVETRERQDIHYPDQYSNIGER